MNITKNKDDINFNMHSPFTLQLQSVESPIHCTVSDLVLCIMDIVSNVIERKKVAMYNGNPVGKTGVVDLVPTFVKQPNLLVVVPLSPPTI